MNGMSDADDKLIDTLIQGAKRLAEGVPIPAEQVSAFTTAVQQAAWRVGQSRKKIRCSRCGELNAPD